MIYGGVIGFLALGMGALDTIGQSGHGVWVGKREHASLTLLLMDDVTGNMEAQRHGVGIDGLG